MGGGGGGWGLFMAFFSSSFSALHVQHCVRTSLTSSVLKIAKSVKRGHHNQCAPKKLPLVLFGSRACRLQRGSKQNVAWMIINLPPDAGFEMKTDRAALKAQFISNSSRPMKEY